MRRCEQNPQIVAVFKQQQSYRTTISTGNNRETSVDLKNEFCIDNADDNDELIGNDYSSFGEVVDEQNEASADEEVDETDLTEDIEQETNEQN